MFAHSLDFDGNFMRLLPPCLSATIRLWYDQFLNGFHIPSRPPTWNEFKFAMTSRYGVTIDDERDAAGGQLVYGLRMEPGESFVTFVDRYNGLRRQAVDQLPPSGILIRAFLRALPNKVQHQVKLTMASWDSAKERDLEEILEAAKNIYEVVEPARGAGKGGATSSPGESASSVGSFDPATSSTKDSK